MKNIIKIGVSIVVAAVPVLFSGCSESWLDTKALSFYTPDNTYVNAEGFYAALTTCERNMRHEFFGDGAPLLTEMIQADICVEGTTDKAGPQMDMDSSILPDANLNSVDRTRIGWYWDEGFKGIKYANVVIARIDNATYKSEAERNAVLGAAYFQRAYRYYKLTHQFGDVPFLDWEINAPKTDFYSYDRWSILEREVKNLEFAYQWVPEKVDRGRTSKAACGVLLMKYYMCLGQFEKAIAIGREIVAQHPLMTNRFTSTQANHPNLMFDLHSVEAKLDMSNTEGLMYVVAYPEVDGSDRIQLMRNAVAFWNSSTGCRTPDGKTGTNVTVAADETNPLMDNNKLYGRGIGRLRNTNYFQYDIWTEKEKNDMRGVYNRDSWKNTSDLLYNHPSLKSSGSEWYGKNIVRNPAMSVEDTIRCWYQWPHYKTYVPDPKTTNGQYLGGETPWYVYRSAEVYLMMGECYYWLNQPGQAAEMLNVVRARAGADPLTAADINIGEILNERARELYYEENRHVEIVRIAYTFAKLGRPCEVFGGRVYKLDNFSGPGGTGSNVKQEGYNFWWDWVNKTNNFYNKGVKHKWAEYKISVHHVLWPVPAGAITSNTNGHINQNIGYPGAETNIAPLTVPADGYVLKPDAEPAQ